VDETTQSDSDARSVTNGSAAARPDSGASDGDPVAAHRDGVVREPSDAADPSYLQPPPGFAVRRPADGDLEHIADLYRRAAPRSAAGTTGRGALRTARDLRRTWEARRNDALVVTEDDRVVGYVEFDEELDPWTPRLEAYAEGRVDPDSSGRGVGTFLMGRVLDRARAAAAENPRLPVLLRTTLVDPRPATLAWFEERGMVAERHLLQLRIDLTTDLPRPQWPRGTRGVRADEVELAALHDALVGAFSDHHLGATDDLDTWRELVVERDRVQLWASVAATDQEDTPVGVALGHVGGEGDPGLGVIVELGVVPAWRGRGLATALLRAAFQRFAGLGVQRVGLEVDDVTLDGALRLYQRAGMEVVHHTVVLRREVSDGG
jgi:GNAT superfamily N-acetyltransferase